MRRLGRAAILVSLVESLRSHESWCGETNIQKATYFLQELAKVPLEFNFTLYKYGPYSFDLSDELTYLCGESFLEIEIRDAKYGPSYATGEMSEFLVERFPKTLRRFQTQVEFVASWLGDKYVPELERLATALYVRLSSKALSSVGERAAKIQRLKPHIGRIDAKNAVEEVDDMLEEFEAVAD